MLTTDSDGRKDIPMATGLLDYFPDALAAVAHVSVVGARKHDAYKPDGSIMWRKDLSTDHADCILRHLADRGTIDPADGLSHTAKVAWRALALLQTEIEQSLQWQAVQDRGDAAADSAAEAPLKRGTTVDDLIAATALGGLDEALQHGAKIVVLGDADLSLDEVAKLLGVPLDRVEDGREIAAEGPGTYVHGDGSAADFATWLTTRERCVHVGAAHTVYGVFDALREFQELRRKK